MRWWLLGVLLVAGCSGGASPPTADEEPASGVVGCAELYGEGVELRADAFDVFCREPDGTTTAHGAAFLECDDGRLLYWGDKGWGYVGEPWHADATEPPAGELETC